MDRKGLVLILVLGILAVLIIIGSAFVSLTNSEMQMVKNQGNSIRAFYLAEAGVEEAVYRLKNGNTIIPDGGTITFTGYLYQAGNDDYTVTIERGGSTYTVTSTGAYPNLTASDKVTRKVRVNVTVIPINGNPAYVTNAITTNGNIAINGNPRISGQIQMGAGLGDQSFQDVFNMTKDELCSMATKIPNITGSVNGITWVELTGNSIVTISSQWTGSGILIIDGSDRTELITDDILVMTGGGGQSQNFQGLIWIIDGGLSINGSVSIGGAIFVEGPTTLDSIELSGGAQLKITYDSTIVNNVLSGLGNTITVSHWEEVYP